MPPWGLPVAFNLPRQNLVSYSFPSIQTEQKKKGSYILNFFLLHNTILSACRYCPPMHGRVWRHSKTSAESVLGLPYSTNPTFRTFLRKSDGIPKAHSQSGGGDVSSARFVFLHSKVKDQVIKENYQKPLTKKKYNMLSFWCTDLRRIRIRVSFAPK